jgi:hypothetical protein
MISDLFFDYKFTSHNIYLEKILHIISKNIHYGYKNNEKIKKDITI